SARSPWTCTSHSSCSCSYEAKGTLDEDEMISVEKIPLTEAVLRAYRGEIKDGKTLAGLLIAEKFLSEGKL
ncbi:MAG: hypothetical protein ACPLRQ_04980, partial [Thermovenabulum sp.]